MATERSVRHALIAVAAGICSSTAAVADGIVIVDMGGNTADSAGVVSRDADGRLYVGAQSTVPADPQKPAQHSLLAFDSIGQTVVTFGSNGVISDSPAAAIAVRSDGVLIRAGGSTISTLSPTGAVLGVIAFPTVASSTGTGSMFATSLAVQPDDQVLIGGGFARGTPSEEWTLARLNTVGTLDPAFGGGAGWLRKDAGTTKQISDLVRLSTGRILALGVPNSGPTGALGRFNADGSTDTTFGTVDGLSSLPACACNSLQVAVDSLGRIYVGGGSIVTRLNANGSTDGSYAGITLRSALSVTELAIDSMDRLVVFATGDNEGYIARFLTNASPDATFGTAGEVFVHASVEEELVAGLLQPDDKPVALLTVAGTWDNAPSLSDGPTDLALARYTSAGVLDVTFGQGRDDADVYPAAFSFAMNSAPFGTLSVVSSTVTITGINARTSVHLAQSTTGSSYSIGCTGSFTSTPGTLLPGDTLCLRHAASNQAGGAAQTIVNVGGRSVAYVTTSTNQPADRVPNAFAFIDQNDVEPGVQITSNTVAINGLAASAPVSIEGGQYSIGCDSQRFTSANGSVIDGDTICVRHVAAGLNGLSVNTTLTIGGVADTFTSTTVPADTTPDTFAFTQQGSVQAGSTIVSNAVTISGINVAVPVTVRGGEYSLGCGGGWTAQVGMINSGQQLCVRHVAANQASATTTTTLTVGTVSSGFVSVTAAAAGGRGGGGGGGPMSWYELAALFTLVVAGWRLKIPRSPAPVQESVGTTAALASECSAALRHPRASPWLAPSTRLHASSAPRSCRAS